MQQKPLSSIKRHFLAEVPLVMVGARKRVNLSIDDRMLAAIDRACELAGINRSAFVTEIAAEWLENNLGAVISGAKPKGLRKRRQLVPA